MSGLSASQRGTPAGAEAGDADSDISAEDLLRIDVGGFEGPLHVLLALARSQRVDLRAISILELVDQYVAFVAEARAKRLDLAAEYLVMASWLALLKSRLLIPKAERPTDEPDAEAAAASLSERLERLELIREAVRRLDARPQLGRDVFIRGAQVEDNESASPLEVDATLFDLLKAYGSSRTRPVPVTYTPRVRHVFALEAARKRLQSLLAQLDDWTSLESLGSGLNDEAARQTPPASVSASLFHAGLELAKHGRVELAQDAPFAPVLLRARMRLANAS
jgi:segregation and condensation protein A